jgi:hypothetical protein
MVSKARLKLRNTINLILLIIFVVAFIGYFAFPNIVFINNVTPDAMGLVSLSFVINMLIHRNTKVITYMLVFGSIFVSSILCYTFASGFWKDISFELIAVSFITLVITILLRKKIEV